MPDLIFIIVTFGFFALSMGYGIFCDPLQAMIHPEKF